MPPSSPRVLLPGLALLALLAGCATTAPETTPVADAGADQAVVLGDAVALDGSASSDADGDSLAHAWEITARPAGSQAALAGADTPTPSFTSDAVGRYTLELTVSDGSAESSDSVAVDVREAYSVGLAKFTSETPGIEDHLGFAIAFDGATVVAGAPLTDTADGTHAGEAIVVSRDGESWGTPVVLDAGANARADRLFGYSVAVSGDVIAVGAPESPSAAGEGAVFVFTRDGDAWGEPAMLTAGPGATNHFGYSVALSGSTLVVGAPYDDTNAADAGAVYVYTQTGGTWSLQGKLIVGAASNELVGRAVAIDGDTLAVGAPGTIGGAVFAGTVYMLERTSEVWSLQGELTGVAAGDEFGRSIGIDKGMLVVGAPSEDTDASNAGAAYVFSLESGVWSQTSKVTAGGAEPDEYFGISVALGGDTFAVGASGDDAAEENGGAVHVFTPAGTDWQRRTLTANDVLPGEASTDSRFGYAVAIDGSGTLAVGDDYREVTAVNNSQLTNAGAFYILPR